MGELFKQLAAHPAVLLLCAVAASAVVLAAVVTFVVSFLQGRSISFWPPNVGPKPTAQESAAKAQQQQVPISIAKAETKLTAGSVLVTSTGKPLRIESDSHARTAASLLRATDGDGREVMVKLFWRGLNPSSSAWAEFSREFSAAEGLQHRNIVRTLDRGLWQGYPFLTSEYFGGGTLYDLIQARDRVTGAEILSIAGQVADGIDYAHSQGRIHRDISPSNILLMSDAQGRVAISDFGIARILGAMDVEITAAKPMLEGTPAYLAPESIRGEAITSSVDIYGFGAVLYAMIAGQPPFPAMESVFELYQAKLHESVPRLSSVRQVPASLDLRLLATMDPDPNLRPGKARAVLSGVEDAILSL